MRHHGPCDLCGQTDFRVIGRKDRQGKPLTTGLCRHCGLVMHVPAPDEEEVAHYYAKRYRRDYQGERVPSSRRVMRAWKNGQRIFRHLSPHLDSSQRIFEVGAGIGCTVKVFEEHGFQASGIEPNKDFNAYTRRHIRAKVANRNLFDLPAEPLADVILLVHVIEHFTSPTQALRHVHTLLAEGGLLYVECPDLAAPFATLGRLFHFAHIYNFTPKTLLALTQKCGFAPTFRFTADIHPDIQILFRKTRPSEPSFAVDAADQVLALIHRYSWLTYHLRASYFKRRMRQVLGYACEALFAKRFVAELERRLAAEEDPTPTVNEPV